MGDSQTLFKLIVFLGFISILAGLVFPGADAPWTAFSDTMANTPFPQFVNPADERFETDLRIVADGSVPPASSFDGDAVDNCDTSANPGGGTDWFGCVNTPDGDVSTASTNSTETQFRVVLSAAGGVPSAFPVIAIRTVTQCDATDPTRIDYIFLKSDDTTVVAEIPTDPFRCESFSNVTVYSYFDTPYPKISDFNNGRVVFNPGSPDAAEFSFLRVTLIYGATAECTGADTLTYIGCIIAGFFNFVIRVGRVIINGFVFLGQVIVYLGTVAFTFLGGLAGTFVFLFAIPGMPSIIQGIFDVILVGCLLWIFFLIAKLMRGTEG